MGELIHVFVGPDGSDANPGTRDDKVTLCGTCQHWGTGLRTLELDEGADDDEEFRPCGAIVHDIDNRARHSMESVEKGLHESFDGVVPEALLAEIRAIRAHKAVVQDGSGYYATLRTRNDFGCVLWAAKEKQ